MAVEHTRPTTPRTGTCAAVRSPGPGPILSRFCRDPSLSRDNSPNSGTYGHLGDHAYHITHVTDDARVPRSSQFVNNWQAPGLNNFRQNAQGGFGLLQIADLTVELVDLGQLCDFRGGNKDLNAEVCNRGTSPVQDGVTVAFLETDLPDQPVDQAKVVCEAVTTKLLLPGECEVVGCSAMLGGAGNIYVDVDPGDKIADCHPGNNLGADAFDLCPG